jgi:endonuclease/exonuclease/phosphatase family metal-dependent hydrolase
VLAVRRSSSAESPAAPVQAVTVGLVGLAGFAVLGGLWTYTEYEESHAYTDEFIATPTVMVYNLHYGVTPGLSGGPAVDLDQLLGVVKEANPDVLLLQEVDRGWILAGGVDILEYFAGELAMEYTYSPAHDPQFGNAVFTSRPFTNARTIELPYGDGPQRRSAAVVEFMGVTYASVHLQHKERDDTRVAQAEALLEGLGSQGRVVVGGDFNDTANSRAFATMIAAGYLSAHGEGKGQDTYVGPDFQAQIDYVFARGVDLRDFEVVDSPWSDHLPLVVTVITDFY